MTPGLVVRLRNRKGFFIIDTIKGNQVTVIPQGGAIGWNAKIADLKRQLDEAYRERDITINHLREQVDLIEVERA